MYYARGTRARTKSGQESKKVVGKVRVLALVTLGKGQDFFFLLFVCYSDPKFALHLRATPADNKALFTHKTGIVVTGIEK